jgi:hypothetical protein
LKEILFLHEFERRKQVLLFSNSCCAKYLCINPAIYGGDATIPDNPGFSHYMRYQWAKAQVFCLILIPGINAGVT